MSTLRLEDVDDLSLEKASDWLEENEISYEHLESHSEILNLIRMSLKKVPEIQRKNEELMPHAASDDFAMKKELHKIYENLQNFLENNLEGELRTHVNTIYGDIEARLKKNIENLIQDENAIIFAGETSAGKSSLLNLLIGADILPSSLLSNTSAICQIHNSDCKSFRVVNVNGETETVGITGEGSDAEKDFAEKLSPFIGRSNQVDGNKIKHVDIYWPIPIIKGNVTIVDTPGVGESEEMTEKLVKYLPKAVAFIYIVNSANAGGVQQDTILKILSEQRKLDKEFELSSFDPKNMVFICNKWDVVNKRGGNEMTWRDTTKKLMRTIPGLTEDQICKMSVREAVKYKKTENMGQSQMYEQLLKKLDQFITDGLVGNVKRHYRWIGNVLTKIEGYIVPRINNAKKSSEEKQKIHKSATEKLRNMEKESKKVRLELIRMAKETCTNVADQLHKHLQKDEVISFLDTWTEGESPEIIGSDIDVTKYKAKQMIEKRLLDAIQIWESETHDVEKVIQKVKSIFNEKCLVFSENLKEVEQILNSDSLPIEEKENSTASFESKEIAIMVASAPLWIPIGLAAFAILVPTGFGYFVVSSIKDTLKSSDYRENKAHFMKRWTHKLLKSLHEKQNITRLINEVYMTKMEARINYLFSNFLPKEIEANRTLLNRMVDDQRNADEIIQLFRPKKENMKVIFTSMKLFDLKYLADDVIDISTILRYKQIGSGSFSDVYNAIWKQNDVDEKAVAIKILKGHDMHLQLSEIDCSRKLKHYNIVEFYGVIFAERERYHGRLDLHGGDKGLPLYDDRLMLVQELCDKNLESLVFGTKKKQCGSISREMRQGETQEFFFNMCVSICNALCYMHGLGYLHRDLKLSNVLVKGNVGKLCDLGFARAESVMTGTSVGTLSHMAPELLDEKLYSYSSDVYSLGILIWEFWYGTRSFSDTNFAGLGLNQFIEAVKRGQRPGCDREHKMMPELIDVVTKCWSVNPLERPHVKQVASELREIDNKYRRVISR